mgnify:CR=1 FL=1
MFYPYIIFDFSMFYTLIKKTAAKRTSAVIGADELFVSDSSTPSDYFFKYSVIDSATGKSVAFSYLYRANGYNSHYIHMFHYVRIFLQT